MSLRTTLVNGVASLITSDATLSAYLRDVKVLNNLDDMDALIHSAPSVGVVYAGGTNSNTATPEGIEYVYFDVDVLIVCASFTDSEGMTGDNGVNEILDDLETALGGELISDFDEPLQYQSDSALGSENGQIEHVVRYRAARQV